jgi:hypothetical protein
MSQVNITGTTHLVRKDESVLKEPCLLQGRSDARIICGLVDFRGSFSETQQRALNLHVRIRTVDDSGVLE